MRVGMGYDAHRLVDGEYLVLGGVEIPFEKKLLAHSDGDVLLHAIADSLLGAAGLGDIGVHFPDNDPVYRGISSLVLLERVREKLAETGLVVQNVDSTNRIIQLRGVRVRIDIGTTYKNRLKELFD